MQNSPDLWLKLYPFPKREGHKYDRGHALIYGGEVMTGAARLAARAAQRIGAGLVTIATPRKSLPVYAESLESVIVREANDVKAWRDLLDDPKRDAVLIGPGLGLGSLQAELVLAALETKKPCILDADGLTNFAAQPEIFFAKLHEQCVLTPHEGEFAKLFGDRIDSAATKLDRDLQAAKIAGCIVLLKGADTIIAAPDGQAILNNNAPPWLATAGAGDVLAGLILGLVAQKMPGFWAAAAAAWLHGRVAGNFGLGLIAEDLVAGVPEVVKELSTQSHKTS
jgi:ADP-dependent NAD(P)H-hydrate dehydratase / NAD(P)H-hydrate epimerase